MDSASRLPKQPSRNDVLTFLSGSSRYGNLGLFIGAGFSKAVLGPEVALSWGELLRKVAEQMGVDYASLPKEGTDYPAITSRICKAYSDRSDKDYAAALKRLKREIARLTAWYPKPEARVQFGTYLSQTSPSWIITTNYDLVIENLLTGLAESLGPNDPLSSPKGIIPVFHLHGSRALPDDLIASQEDYVSLFRPTEYRQVKLALTIKESTTLLLGYGLGDVNVLTALDWSHNVFKSSKVDYPNEVIQVLRTAEPNRIPYRDRNGILILEAREIADFFDEFLHQHTVLVERDIKDRAELELFAESIKNPDNKMINSFIDDFGFRFGLFSILKGDSNYLLPSFVSFLERCIEETWVRVAPHGAFEGYGQNLDIILDILTEFPYERFPPALFQVAANALDRVSYFVGHEVGQSWKAGGTWDTRKSELPELIISDLRTFAVQHECMSLLELLDR
jgi:hypothetical protein